MHVILKTKINRHYNFVSLELVMKPGRLNRVEQKLHA